MNVSQLPRTIFVTTSPISVISSRIAKFPFTMRARMLCISFSLLRPLFFARWPSLHSNQLRRCRTYCNLVFLLMYIYEGIVSQKDGISDGWALSYFLRPDLAAFPARAIVRVSDLGNQRSWGLGDISLDFRSARSPLDTQIQGVEVEFSHEIRINVWPRTQSAFNGGRVWRERCRIRSRLVPCPPVHSVV